jgi:flagellar basal-body rod protein FlgB
MPTVSTGEAPPMDLSRIPLFAALAKRMDWIGERHNVLAQNVANADTPGYVAQDLKEPDFASLLADSGKRLALTISAPGQLSAPAPAGGYDRIPVAGDRTLTGNGVSLEEEMLKVSQNASDYSLVETIYRAQLGLIKTALGGGNSAS